jgi:hypothetical protein
MSKKNYVAVELIGMDGAEADQQKWSFEEVEVSRGAWEQRQPWT